MNTRVNVNSDKVWRSPGYPMSQAVVEPDGRRVHLSGQVAWDTDFNVLHVGDAASQTRVAFENIKNVLAASGGTLDDIVALTTFYVREEDRDPITEVRRSILNAELGPATVAIQVAKIWNDELLVELVATAVIPTKRFKEPKL